MAAYIARRLLMAVPVLLGVIVTIFIVAKVTPGDPALIMLGERAPAADLARMREQLGLNDPWHIQLGHYLQGLTHGDLGISYRTKQPVVDELAARFPSTLKLTTLGLLLAVAIGIPLGVTAAAHQNSWIDQLSVFFATVGTAMPVFWLGLLMVILFSLQLHWLPATGSGTWQHYVMPAATLGFPAAALIARLTRASMLETLGQDYVRTAKAKGVAQRAVIYRHALKNALIPVITVVGLQFGTLLGGAVLTETIFAWPGIGRLIVQSIGSRDFPVIRGGVLQVALVFVLINLAVDLSYSFVDPRIKYA